MIPTNFRISRLIDNAAKLKKYPSASAATDQTISDASSASANVRTFIFLYPDIINANQCNPKIRNRDTKIDQNGRMENRGRK